MHLSEIWNNPNNLPPNYDIQVISNYFIQQVIGLAPNNQTHFHKVLEVYLACAQNLTDDFRKHCRGFIVKGLICFKIEHHDLLKTRLDTLRKSGLNPISIIINSNCTLMEKQAAQRLVHNFSVLHPGVR